MIRTLLFLLLAGALAAYAFWVYLRAELPVRGGHGLALVRAATLVLLLALLFDVRFPWGDRGGGARWALLDASLSMSAGDGAAWRDARDRSRALEAEGWTVVPFGEAIGAGSGDAPRGVRTELGPALARAAEAGVAEVRVLSDLRFQDPVDAASVLASGTVAPVFEAFGGAVVNAGIAGFAVADQGRRGEPVTAEVELFAEGVTDSLVVEVREEGRLVASTAVAPPAPGRRGRAAIELPAPDGEGRVRYSARLHQGGDAFPSDDRGVAYMMAGYEEGGLVVVSLRPDWEPRALLPALAEATGLPAAGYLRVGPDRFAPMGRALERGAPVDSAAVGRAAAGAALLVVHGLDAGTDAWGRALAKRPGRVVVWPLDAAGAGVAGVRTGAARAGEWYAALAPGASPVAADLAGARLQDLPPLSALLPHGSRDPAGAPLLVQLRGTGPAEPALLLDRSAAGRRAVVLASGFWRWAAREGAGREAYRRLWSGVAGWLLAEETRAPVAEVRPHRWVVPAGEVVRWWIPGEASDSVRLEILTDSGSVSVLDTTLAGGVAAPVRPLPGGTYRFRAAGRSGPAGEGRFDVEERTEELLALPAVPEPAEAPRTAGPPPGGPGSPLRVLPWVYLVLLSLLCAEWVGRRRAGLR